MSAQTGPKTPRPARQQGRGVRSTCTRHPTLGTRASPAGPRAASTTPAETRPDLARSGDRAHARLTVNTRRPRGCFRPRRSPSTRGGTWTLPSGPTASQDRPETGTWTGKPESWARSPWVRARRQSVTRTTEAQSEAAAGGDLKPPLREQHLDTPSNTRGHECGGKAKQPRIRQDSHPEP